MSIAFVFPGQGSQSVGMLASLEADATLRATFAEASAVLGYDLWALTQAGPAERLNATECTQPAMLTAGVALWRVWQARGGVEAALVAGHSLGEFTALVCAGAIEFRAAVDLVRQRGQLMQAAVPEGTGAMAAILGLEDEQVREACRRASGTGTVEAVNFNSPGQVVIAGTSAAVTAAIETARELGAKRALLLPVSVPAHSSLMQPAAVRFAQLLARLTLSAPRLTYVSAVDAAIHREPEDIRALLGRQLALPVLWQDTVRALIAQGAARILECGPGKVLTGMNKRIERRPELQYAALEDAASIDAEVSHA
ncbi:MAG TPA: ACP S-malonyltransferase [Steroidobacteraceae bacterium]|nr:ACP S-malonyltransferase [Steroidobacteraceae bacterium]